MPRIDFNALPPEALLRSGDFLRPSGPVPVGRTVWSEMVADGRAPAPVVRRPRLTCWRWCDVREFLERFAAGSTDCGGGR